VSKIRKVAVGSIKNRMLQLVGSEQNESFDNTIRRSRREVTSMLFIFSNDD
jgi:hypothetical protein